MLGLQGTLGHHAWLPVCFLKIGCVLFASCPTYNWEVESFQVEVSRVSHQKRGPLCPWTPAHKNRITAISFTRSDLSAFVLNT